MNRADRRKFNKQHKTNYTKEQMDVLEFFAKMRAGEIDAKSFSELNDMPFIRLDHELIAPDGTEVKLRADDILSRPDIKNDKYIEFVKNNTDKILHITRENGAKENLVTIEEDQEKIWLFDIYSDLLFKKEDGSWDIL